MGTPAGTKEGYVYMALLRIGRFRGHDGRVFFAAMSVWALTRVAAAFTWRDPVVVGPVHRGRGVVTSGTALVP